MPVRESCSVQQSTEGMKANKILGKNKMQAYQTVFHKS